MNNQPLCEKLWYLIGVPSQYIDSFEVLNQGPMVEIRKLCSLRSIIIANFMGINEQFKNQVQLREIPETSKLIKDLFKHNIEIVNIGSLSRNVMELNKLIDIRIEQVTFDDNDILQEWIQDLFRMPNGDAIAGVQTAVRKYRQFKNYYPYQKYINWPFEATLKEDREKNILSSDTKLRELLAKNHYKTITPLLDFVGIAGDATVVVDCENSDAQRLYDALAIAKIGVRKIILIDDTHTNRMWDEIVQEYRKSGILIEHDELPRLKEQKSLVDLRMVAKTCEEFYKNGVRHFILTTSDSDIWALISSLPDANIMLLAEKCKCGDLLIDAATQRNIQLVFMEDITNESTELMDRIVYRELSARLQKFTPNEHSMKKFVSETLKSLNLFDVPDDVFDSYVQWVEEKRARNQVETAESNPQE